MFDKIGVYFFDDQIVELFYHLLWFLFILGEFEPIFGCIV